ncbi:DUF6531 domain-containing protein [Saccharopolyspora indica]|uniref:RHS repeat-associated core domain-containing protein n=1 Tax=Saccharopolyspora indica TaxID=1229659 RepID=UPI0022EAFFB1|nr:RHS repeat-associated core domain-containing protein [Saccharopolyspora indica]MDA3647596.1 DUF6531 domain-containing protein [Saccharopolyspora indica]
MGNPLVAEREDSTKSFSGVPILESVDETKKAIESGDWASGVMGAVGTGLDALGMALDPFGAILSAGVGWLMEHVGPLSDALDSLTGDADQIKAHSETWKNVAAELGEINTEMTNMVNSDVADWAGEAADSYRKRSEDTGKLIEAAQKAAEGASEGVGTAGEVVAAVRTLVRDIIAELVGSLVSWALQVLATLGLAMAWVVPQVVMAVAKTAAKIAKITTKLVKAMKSLGKLFKKLKDGFGDAKKALDKIKKDSGGSGNKPDSPKPDRGKGDNGPNNKPDNNDPASTHSQSTGGNESRGGNPPDSTPRSPDSTPRSPDSGPTPSPPPARDRGLGGQPGSRGGSNTGSNKPENPRDRAVGTDDRKYISDPVDVATGEVVMTQVDLTIAGSPDLVLERTHISSYRAGRWFGASWSSTVDQRLEVDEENVCYFSADGMILVYPIPTADAPVLPVEGPRYPLRRTADGYRLDDRAGTLVFTAVAGSGERLLPLVAVERANAPRITIEHSADGAPSAIRRSDGYEARFTTERGRIVEVAAVSTADGSAVPVVEFGYDERGRLTRVVNSTGRAMTFDYDESMRLTGWQDRTGTWYRYSYDRTGRCVRTVGVEDFFNGTFSYDLDNRITRHTDALGCTSEFHLNPAGQLIAEVDPLGHAKRYSWDRYDRLLSRTDELGRTTRYTYADDGELVAVIRPDGSEVKVAATAEGGLSLEVQDEDAVDRREYSPTAAPDLFSDQVGIAPPLPSAGLPNPLDEESPTAVPGERDLFGRPRTTRTASGAAVRIGWTVEGKRSVRTGPLGRHETWHFDAEGNAVEHRGAAGQVTRRGHGPFGLPVVDTDPAGGRTRYAYDREQRLVTVTDPQGLTWHYTYDPAGRLVEEVDFDGRRLVYAYDEAGQLIRMTNGLGQVTEYTYDVLGNVVERRTPAGTTTYDYDHLGRLVRATNRDSVLEIVRDRHGRVIAESVNRLAVRWSYDETAVHRGTPGGVDSTWRFDAAGTPTVLATAGHEMRFEHDAAGRETARHVDGRVVLTQEFDAEDQLVEQVITDGKRRRFTYRVDGQLVGIDDSSTGPQRFRLDPAGRIAEVARPTGVERYSYDGSGNITGAATPWADPTAGPRRYANNALVEAGSTGYVVDHQGRVVARHGQGSWTYSWDPLDRMTGLTTPDGTRWTYLYDPLGRRFAKQRWVADADGAPLMAEEIRFIWSGADLVEQITTRQDGSRAVLTWERHPLDGRPVAQVEYAWPRHDERFRPIVTNAIGTPTELLDADGTIAWEARTSLWGKALPSPAGSAASTPLRFPGQYHDAESDLHYNVYRYYDPETARYLSQDPLGLRPGPNPAAYVPSPLQAADPLGLAGSGSCRGSGSNGMRDRPGGDTDAKHVDSQQKKPDGKPDANQYNHDLRNMSLDEYYKWTSKWDDVMKHDPNGTWLWSGGGKKNDGEWQSVMDLANKQADAHGGTTLEGKLDKDKIKMPDWPKPGEKPDYDKEDVFRESVWTEASSAFARNAKGDVNVILVTGAEGSRRPNNVFDMTEFPILRKNPDVERIITHDVKWDPKIERFTPTGAHDVLWENPNRPKPKL